MWKHLIFIAFFARIAFCQPAQVGVYMSFDHKPPGTRFLETVQRETSALLRPAEVSREWGMLKDTDGTKAFPEVFILNFRGACNTLPSLFKQRTASDPLERLTPLGLTKALDGRMVSQSEIHCDHVRQGLVSIPGLTSAEVFAGALAKVIAHELFHYLTESVGHGDTGLAKPVLQWDELGQRFMRFASRDLLKLRYSQNCLERDSCR